MNLELADLETIQDSALKALDERIAKTDPSNTGAFERELIRLESQLEQLYSLTAAMARREPDVARTAELWARLVRWCDLFAARAFQLADKYRLNTSTYDTILDIRTAADELRALHSP
jgi:hypothetical protein